MIFPYFFPPGNCDSNDSTENWLSGRHLGFTAHFMYDKRVGLIAMVSAPIVPVHLDYIDENVGDALVVYQDAQVQMAPN